MIKLFIKRFMVKKHSILNIIGLLFCLISITKSDDDRWLIYDFESNSVSSEEAEYNQKETFGVDFKNGDINRIPFYFKITVTSKDDNPAPILCFSATDQNCLTRDQLIKDVNNKSIFLWLKREEFFKDGQELYIVVECQSNKCKYKLDVQGEQIATLPSNVAYSYLVGDNNKEMRFDILGDETDAYLTVSLDGSSQASLSVDNAYDDGIKYRTGRTLIFKLEDYERNTATLTSIIIRGAKVGEYLTLTIHLVSITSSYEGLGPENYLLPNGPEITGYLDENILYNECFPINLNDERFSEMNEIYITGKIHTKYAMFFIENEQRNLIRESVTEVFDGQLAYVLNNNGKMNYVCLQLLNKDNLKQSNMAFTISLSMPKGLSSTYNFYQPQLVGEIYTRIIPKGSISVFSGTKLDNTLKKYDYSLLRKKGLSKMYIAECKTFPYCKYNVEDLNNLISPKDVNKMTIWTTTIDKSSAIGNEKYVIVVYCADGDNDNNGYCEFETSIFQKEQDIYLVENEKFSKYLNAGEKGNIISDLQKGRQIEGLTIDIMIFSGDVTFNCYQKLGETQQYFDKYYLSNKIVFHINSAQFKSGEIIVEYKAEINSFFTIQYSVGNYNLDQSEKVTSGESYLVQIDPTSSLKSKNIYLSNYFYKNKNPFLANFFALNCEFEVKRQGDDSPIEFYDGYAQQILESSSPEYTSESYLYTIKVTEADISNYNHKMCMLYIAGYESETEYASDIIVGENINQQIIFQKNLNKIRFLYPHADASKDLIVYVNVIDKAYYKVNILANNERLEEGTVTRTQSFYFKGSTIRNNCDENTLCPIVVELEVEKGIIETDPMAEITIREVRNTPTYLKKSQAKIDFVCGDRIYYLYTDIGKNEVGDVTVNFFREFGNVWGKIVRKDQKEVDEEANWRGIYRMPSEEWEDSLTFNKYTKKLIIETDNTLDCIEGCYLLLSVQISQIGEYVEDYKLYPFSILTKITPSNVAYTDIPKVVIQVDEFVIGNVDISVNERIHEFFEIWLPHDSNTVEFDFQSSVAGLYINVGGSRPATIKNSHFKLLPAGKEKMLILSKTEILLKAKSLNIDTPNPNSLQDLNLVIGVWTSMSDSINTELYSLRVHQPPLPSETPIDITLINTDQKIMCNPKFLSEGGYSCLFMVTYDDEDANLRTPLLAYAESVNNGALTFIYGNYIDREIYDKYMTSDLQSNIPTYQTCELNSRDDGVNYIYVRSLIKGKYMFINVITDQPDTIMIVTSMPVLNYITYDLFEYNPNPTTEQLLSVPGEKLRLAFPVTDSILVNIVTLDGHAEVSWKSDPYNIFVLRGVGDRISLYSGKNIDELVIHRLYSTNNKLTKMENPGFAFYISYYLVDSSNDIIFEEINYGKSLEMSFKDTKLPLVLYNKIGVEYRDINIAITFKDNDADKTGILEYNPLLISAILVKERTIYDAKKDSELGPSIERSVIGHYDIALKTAQVFLSEEKIKSYNIKELDIPSIFVKIDKLGDIDDNLFNKFSLEAQISGVNDGVVPVEKIYHYGRVRNSDWQYNYYRLRTDKERPFMRIQIAFNSENLNFIVSESEVRENCTFLHTEKQNGKVYITLKADTRKDLYYLYIFKKSRTMSEEHLNNYAFKYINAKAESDIYDYPISNSPEIEINESQEEGKDVITCTFNKLEIEEGKANITYFFKVVDNATHYYGEEVNTIAVTESPYYSVYERNPKATAEGKITLTAKDYHLSNWVYLNVIAQVQQNNVLEYISYNGKKFVRPNDNNNEEEEKKNTEESSDNTTLFVVIGVILITIVIGLVVAIFIYQLRNKKLLNQVKHISFQQANNQNSNVDPNLLFQKSGDNS